MEQEQVEGIVRDTKATIGESAREMTDKAANLSNKVAAVGEQAIAQTGQLMQDATRGAGELAGRAATGLNEQRARVEGYMERYVAEQPLTALIIAAAVGYGLAYLIHRS
jgi:ElaB/YqjD/DUF883 family membrane-anchored ribosome-binding protein